MNTYTLSLPKRIELKAFLIIGICLLIPFYKYILQIYPSIITSNLMTDFDLTGAGLGNLAATFYYAYLLSQCFVGVLLDKYNVRYVLSISVFTCAMGAYFFSLANNITEACIGRALMGIGVAFAPIAYMKITSMWCSPQRFSFINGLLASASMLGAVCGESALTYSINSFGWRNSLLGIALSGIVLSIICMAFLKSSPQSITTKTVNNFSFAECKNIFRNKQNWLLCIYSGFAFSPLAIFGGLWGNPFLQQAYHLNKTQASNMISLIFIGLGFGGPLIGLIASFYPNKKKIMIYGSIISFFSLVSILYANFLPLFFLPINSFLFGLSLGSYMLVFVIGKEINLACLTATVMTLINASEAILDSITEPLIGKILDYGWDGTLANGVHYFSLHSYRIALLILPLYLLIAMYSISKL